MFEKLFKNKIFTSLAAIFCCALWGISTPIVKMGYSFVDESHVPSLVLWLGLQFVFAGVLIVGVYSAISKKFVYPKRKSVKGVALVSLLQTVLQYSLLYVGLSMTTSVKGAILKSTDVFFVALISSLLFKTEKLTVKKTVSCIVGFAGIVIMNLDGLSLSFNFGDGLITLGIIAYSFSLVMINIFTREEDPITLCGYQMAFGGAVMLIGASALGGAFDFVGMLPIFVGLSLIYAVSYTLWTVLLKYNSASSITIFSFMMPVFGVIFSSFMLDEKGGVAPVNLGVALVLVCLGIIIWGYEGKDKRI